MNQAVLLLFVTLIRGGLAEGLKKTFISLCCLDQEKVRTAFMFNREPWHVCEVCLRWEIALSFVRLLSPFPHPRFPSATEYTMLY